MEFRKLKKSSILALFLIKKKYLKFLSHIKYTCKKVTPSLNCFCFIRRELTHQTAKQASSSAFKALITLFKQTIKETQELASVGYILVMCNLLTTVFILVLLNCFLNNAHTPFPLEIALHEAQLMVAVLSKCLGLLLISLPTLWARLWNCLPTDLELETNSKKCNRQLNEWLKATQTCPQ